MKKLKFKNINFIILMIILIILPTNTKALTIYVTNDSVNIRSSAGTTYSTLGQALKGTSYEVVNTASTLDASTGCSTNKWYQISYNNSLGYICSTYTTTSIVDNTNDEYYRPWTTPKKSIKGGALYISKFYIAKGQDSIYLKRFNVSPNSAYAKYTHQYQTNLTAVFTEAKASYNVYLKNNLLSQPLVFEIPVYNNMPLEATPYPNGQSNMSGIEMLDSAFEAKLDEQKFPESYKRKLRALHVTYPNWIFKSLQTNLDWNSAVLNEQPVSYVYSYNDSNLELLEPDSTQTNCKIDNSPYCLKEGSTWYLANKEATAYYLDPRNFLTDSSILMFEKLSYSNLYTEQVIQSYLNGTFMAGKSAIDNQNYASIFVEAGKEANISPIYLASLVIQEVGVNGSISTSGTQFTYNNVTYIGLYNFYNIGAFSSSPNPVLAGLIWANGGSTATIVTGVTPTNESSLLSKFGLNKTGDYITGISLGQTVGGLKAVNNTKMSILDSSNNVLNDNSLIATGTKITLTGEDAKTFTSTVVVYGDINGDGSINALDLLYIRKYLLGTYTLIGANKQAAHIAKNETIGAVDLLHLRKFLLDSNTYKIAQ